MREALKGIRSEERGVTAIVVAVCLLAIMAAAMLTLDAGNLWSNRRNLITGTDSAALVGARDFITSGSTTCPSALADLTANSSNAFSYTCQIVQNGASGTGYVVVTARKPSTVGFGKAVGVGDQQIYSMSAAQIGFVSAAEGLRPPGFCMTNSHIQEWLNLQNGTITQATYDALRGSGASHPIYAGAGVVHRISFTKASPSDCGVASTGNWGWMDFNGGSNSTADQKAWLDSGYSNPVGVGDCYADGTNQQCQGDTGSSGSSGTSYLDALIASHQIFFVSLYDNSSAGGPGGNTTFDIKGFVGVKLWGYKMNGPDSGRYFDLEFLKAQLDGICCSSTGLNTGAKGAKICSVDHDPATLDSRCRLS